MAFYLFNWIPGSCRKEEAVPEAHCPDEKYVLISSLSLLATSLCSLILKPFSQKGLSPHSSTSSTCNHGGQRCLF